VEVEVPESKRYGTPSEKRSNITVRIVEKKNEK
jgi:hypothetical protein